MNPELEKLFEVVFTDGFVSPKEREVLKKKAIKLGYSEGEIEIMINARIYDTTENNDDAKCPSCGESINPDTDSFCPSCNTSLVREKSKKYTLDNREDKPLSDQEYFFGKMSEIIFYRRLGLDFNPKKNFEGPGFEIFKWFKIIFTAGLYIPYKLILRKEALFESRLSLNQAMIYKSELYGDMAILASNNNNDTIESVKSKKENRANFLVKTRFKAFLYSLLWFLIFGLPAYGLYYLIVNYNNRKEMKEPAETILINNDISLISIDEKIVHIADSLFISGNISAIPEVLEPMSFDKEDITRTYIAMLIEQKKYDEARKLIPDDNTAYTETIKQLELAEALDKTVSTNQ